MKKTKKGPQPLYHDADWQREKKTASVPWRPESRRDYARLLHSSAFRRLQGKTQLFPGNESDFFRNRLTHSLEVAQIATAIGSKLNFEQSYLRTNRLDIDLLEFAGIAHDLGHPPFGHNGEKALDDCMKKFGGFEGNAQTLRILSRLEKKDRSDSTNEPDNRLGLNLCYRTLASILKYDKEIPLERKKSARLIKGYYSSEKDLVKTIKKLVGGDPNLTAFKTIECQIMDIADDIAYSTYDLEDAFKVGFLSPLRILQLSTEDDIPNRIATDLKKKSMDVDADKVRTVLTNLFGHVINKASSSTETAVIDSYRSSRALRDGHYRTAFTSKLVDAFISGIRFNLNEKKPQLSHVYLEPSTQISVEVLKRFTFEVLIESPMLKFIEFRGYEIVCKIFDALAGNHGYKLLPDDCRSIFLATKNKARRRRLICDFVAGMTDRYAWEFYGRLTADSQTIFKPTA